jgi:hypothetical protein
LKALIEIEMDRDAFQANPMQELGRILFGIIEKYPQPLYNWVRGDSIEDALFDSNGNKVGVFSLRL